MDFGVDQAEHGLQLVARDGAIGRGETALRRLVGDVLHDGRPFGEDGAIVQFERWHIAVGVDGQVVATIGGLLGLEIDAHQLEGQARLAQGDVGGVCAGAGGEIELHEGVLLGGLDAVML